MIVVNRNMLQLLYDLVISQAVQLPSDLQNVLSGGLLEEDVCWFLAACRGDPKYTTAQFGDRTGLECFVNSVHVDDSEPVDPITLQKQGLAYTEALRKLLDPHGAFKIILAFCYSGAEDDPANKLTCTVRFHKVRLGEHWLEDDLEVYKMDSLLILTTGDQPHHMLTFAQVSETDLNSSNPGPTG
jgi:hypothetical protein